MADSYAEAMAQTLVVPSTGDWFEFAHTLSGYNIAAELEEDIHDLAGRIRERYVACQSWPESLIELRLTLFWIARMVRFSDGPGTDMTQTPEFQAEIESLLVAISTADERRRNSNAAAEEGEEDQR